MTISPAADQAIDAHPPEPLEASLLPPGVRSRFVENINGLHMHVLEAGFESPGRPCLLLLHGFPELAYSWRKLMPVLADAGYHVVAPDQRGYGRTTGWDGRYEADLDEFRMLNLARDAIGLVHALGHRSVKAVIGHDFGSPVAAWCALVRPDVFRSVVLMSAPFGGPPALPFDTANRVALKPALTPDLPTALARLPRARKHYQWYYSTPEANRDMLDAPQGLHAFLRAYYHMKSADWPENRPYELSDWSATSMAKLPLYYVMNLDSDMPATVAPYMPGAEQVAACRWLPDHELAVYVAEYARVGFQGGLQWYRCSTGGRYVTEHQLFAGRTIDVPCAYIAGASDWGTFQKPGELKAMVTSRCTRMLGVHLVDGAGHWIQQEQPHATLSLVDAFLREVA
jgi:pimeloyl-ACP methyl ester carboxylesterase